MALIITEDWIRDRVQLNHNNLEDVRSLSLPGTYHEKISGLGTALRSFTRLKHLDLSRNAIDSLQGLETLKMMEKLNLYYNNIGGLQELYRLRQNEKLQDLDLRLNPVARNEPDYRLFLIHMLPNLRRLDDRAVRDSERKAALQHFSSEEATAFTEHPKPPEPSHERPPNPRAEHVKNLAKPVTVLDEDDVAILDLISLSGNLTRPAMTGSSATAAEIEDYSPDSIRKMNLAGVGLGEPVPTSTFDHPASHQVRLYETSGATEGHAGLQQQHTSLPPTVESLQQRYPHIPIILATPPSPTHKAAAPGGSTGVGQPLSQPMDSTAVTRKNRVQFADDANLKFQDEIEAYTSYKAQGHFTPNPGSSGSSMPQSQSAPPSHQPPSSSSLPPKPPESAAAGYLASYPASSKPQSGYHETSQPSVELYSQGPNTTDKQESLIYQELPSTHSITPSTITTASSVFHHGNTILSEEGAADQPVVPNDPVISKISDLVDKYWNGAKSLLSNPRFKSQLGTVLRELFGSSTAMDAGMEHRLQLQEEELMRLRTENIHLRERTVPGPSEPESADDAKLKSGLIRAQRDLSILRNRLQTSMEENKALQMNMLEKEKMMTSLSGLDKSQAQQNDVIRHENESLRQDIAAMAGQMKQTTQLQELANMLQDSHKSLVQTNEHLLHELEETRTRHEHEVRQLHWSYDQLKKTVGYTPKVGNASTVLNGKTS